MSFVIGFVLGAAAVAFLAVRTISYNAGITNAEALSSIFSFTKDVWNK